VRRTPSGTCASTRHRKRTLAREGSDATPGPGCSVALAHRVALPWPHLAFVAGVVWGGGEATNRALHAGPWVPALRPRTQPVSWRRGFQGAVDPWARVELIRHKSLVLHNLCARHFTNPGLPRVAGRSRSWAEGDKSRGPLGRKHRGTAPAGGCTGRWDRRSLAALRCAPRWGGRMPLA
jgi:hypothetical protein